MSYRERQHASLHRESNVLGNMVLMHTSLHYTFAWRVCIDIACLVFSFLAPWWCVLLLVVLVMLGTQYYELIFIGVVLNILYGGVGGIALYTLALVCIAVCAYEVRRVLWHSRS